MIAQKIDCHCHIVNESIRRAYFEKTDGYAVVMDFIDKFIGHAPPSDAFATVMGDERLFLCPAVDISEAIEPQLAVIEAMLPNDRIVGIKIYLTYQAGRADDPKLYPVYAFAEKHRLSVTYHTGSCSLVLPTDNDMAGSDAVYVQRVAKAFPTVNFIVAHMDDPRYDACIRIVHEQENMFTDFSGAYEPGTHEGSDMAWAIETFAKAIHRYPDTYRKILYGTDFCPPIDLSAVEEYDVTIAALFAPQQRAAVYFENCLRAFPKIQEYLKQKGAIS